MGAGLARLLRLLCIIGVVGCLALAVRIAFIRSEEVDDPGEPTSNGQAAGSRVEQCPCQPVGPAVGQADRLTGSDRGGTTDQRAEGKEFVADDHRGIGSAGEVRLARADLVECRLEHAIRRDLDEVVDACRAEVGVEIGALGTRGPEAPKPVAPLTIHVFSLPDHRP
jgi:hypothetical protein